MAVWRQNQCRFICIQLVLATGCPSLIIFFFHSISLSCSCSVVSCRGYSLKITELFDSIECIFLCTSEPDQMRYSIQTTDSNTRFQKKRKKNFFKKDCYVLTINSFGSVFNMKLEFYSTCCPIVVVYVVHLQWF